MEEAATTEHAGQGKEQRGEERLHREDASVREEKKSTGSVSTTLLVGTSVYSADIRDKVRSRPGVTAPA